MNALQRFCPWCEEGVLPEEEDFRGPRMHIDANGRGSLRLWHRECAARSVLGSVAHLERRCSCFGGDQTDGDPPGYTRRQAAKAALELAQKQWAQERRKELIDALKAPEG